jgi:putative ATPase
MKEIPLAEYLRPKNLSEFVGQAHLLAEGKVLNQALNGGLIFSMIFWGPPGVGKTTLANLIAGKGGRDFFALSAVNSGVKEVREVIEKANASKTEKSVAPILFIDEIHRFSKSQQDSLLGAVEKGTVVLIGATTENPSFEVISPLLSRCRLFVLENLQKEDLIYLLHRAIGSDYFDGYKIALVEHNALIALANGDARKLLGTLELIIKASATKEIEITDALVMNCVQQNIALYDKNGEQHYDVISAFIKSIRGSDPNAAVYWLARMIHGGEDPLFIARRMIVLASEDIGNANPTALVLANACFEACHKIGYPECRIVLSQTVIYLAGSPKSNASYMAIETALKMVKEEVNLPVPLHLRNAVTGTMKNLGYGKNYEYAHNYPGNFIAVEFLPDKISGNIFYNPGDNAREKEIRDFLKRRWQEKYNY